MWIIFSLLSALFSALMTILIKISLKGINPILSLTIRSIIVCFLLMASIMINGSYKEIKTLNKQNIIWIVITSIITFLTWIFYYLALNQQAANKVASIDKISLVIVILLSFLILKEKIKGIGLIGIMLILIGSILVCL